MGPQESKLIDVNPDNSPSSYQLSVTPGVGITRCGRIERNDLDAAR